MSTKMYLYKLESEKDLYAWTINKDYAKEFESQRNMKIMKKKTKEITSLEFKLFSNKYKNKQLVKDYLNDGETDIEIISTIDESTELSDNCNRIYERISEIQLLNDRRCYGLRKKYEKCIDEIAKEIVTYKELGDVHPTLQIDTFKLFFNLFSNTFIEKIND